MLAFRFPLVTTAALSLVAFSQSALGQQATVRFRASDLTTPAGQRAITSRIHDAAARACFPGPGASMDEMLASESCTRDLSKIMIAKVNALTTASQLAAVAPTR